MWTETVIVTARKIRTRGSRSGTQVIAAPLEACGSARRTVEPRICGLVAVWVREGVVGVDTKPELGQAQASPSSYSRNLTLIFLPQQR